MLKTKKGVIMFTDIKDFTLKTSLLTPRQVNKLMQKLEKILVPCVKKYKWEIIKIIWDAHMVVFSDIQDGTNCWIEIQEQLSEINNKEKISLNKVEIKMSLNFWTLSRKMTIKWTDYFGDIINVSSRIIDKTPANNIFLTGNMFEELQKNKYSKIDAISFLSEVELKGILYKNKVYYINYSNSSNHKVLLEKINGWEKQSVLQKSNEHIESSVFQVSSIAAIISLQPIPFLDAYWVVFLHIYLARLIAKEYKIELSKEEIKDVLATIFSSIGWAYGISQILSGVTKIWLPIVWWYLIMPLNFALTYWIWKVLNYYFYNKSIQQLTSTSDIKDVFVSSQKQGIEIWRKKKKEILSEWKKYKDDFVKKMEEYKNQYSDVVDHVKQS